MQVAPQVYVNNATDRYQDVTWLPAPVFRLRVKPPRPETYTIMANFTDDIYEIWEF